MTSERKIRANRENARASTGPKTVHGRARAARNALRHALSLSVYSDAGLSEEVEALAQDIAGVGANAEIRGLACRVAEAHIDLRRVRYARHKLLSEALNSPCYSPRRSAHITAQLNHRLGSNAMDDVPLEARMKLASSTPEGLQKLASIISQEIKRLRALDRYERRALSRRTRAVRAFDFAKS